MIRGTSPKTILIEIVPISRSMSLSMWVGLKWKRPVLTEEISARTSRQRAQTGAAPTSRYAKLWAQKNPPKRVLLF